MLIPDLDPQTAISFVSTWHYSRTAVAGMLRFGWVIDGDLVGVSIYDPGVHQIRTGVFGPEYYRHVIHHHRLAIRPDAPDQTASRFIGAILQWLRVNRTDVWAIVTYADLCEQKNGKIHNGTIYRATNAVYTGIKAKGNLKFEDTEGQIRTTQGLKHVGTWPERRAEAARRGWTESRCKGKARYVYLLGTKRQRRSRPPMLWPVLEWKTEGLPLTTDSD